MRRTVEIKKPGFDKYDYYRRAVQSPDTDVVFIRDTYREIRKKEAITLREDFCGTFAICCEWAKLNKAHRAYGIDVDSEPVLYGISKNLQKLAKPQRDRVRVQQADVLNPGLPKADVICALNFSHYIFRDRAMMKSYFHNAYSTLNRDGILLVDCFGGTRCQEANEEYTDHKDFIYYWDQESFDPVTNYATFHIHFKPSGQPKIEKAFTYEWRMWTIPELREMMSEVGFRKTLVYWEGTAKDGTGNGVFTPTEVGEECEAWIAYVIGVR